MSESGKTAAFVTAAAILLALAIFASPSRPEPAAFSEEGKPLFPEFDDNTKTTSIEIVSTNEETGSPEPFKVERRKGRWVIPSHEDYPAEAEKRLNETAARVVGLKRDSLRSERVEDHEGMGVLDPLDTKATGLKSRGRRAILRDETGRVQADFVVGNEVPGKAGFRFVRLPGEKRTYAVKTDLDLSASFHDWIEKNLLKTERWKLRRVVVDKYRVDEGSGSLVKGEVLHLFQDPNGTWKAEGQTEQETLESLKLENLLMAITEIKIVDVRRKPAGITRDLKKAEGIEMTREVAMQLASKGFFFTRDGNLVSNEGEVRLWTDQGVRYVLRFGELASGGDQKEERRYIFLTADFDETTMPEPPEEEKKKEWKEKVEAGKKEAQKLNDRFADWYYVIPGDQFKHLRISRVEIVTPKQEPKPPGEAPHDPKPEEKKEEPKPPVPPEEKKEDPKSEEKKEEPKPEEKREEPKPEPKEEPK